MTTIKQMLVRCNHGHYYALKCISEGKQLSHPSWKAGNYRGLTTILDTLAKWSVRNEKGDVTELGKQFIKAYEEKWPRHAESFRKLHS